jgi:hypothetical protein
MRTPIERRNETAMNKTVPDEQNGIIRCEMRQKTQ